MKIIVTGGAGFIGYHVVKYLHSRGYKIKVIDNFSRAFFSEKLKKIHGIEIKQIDIRDKFMLINEFKGYDLIIHLAALINVEESLKYPDLYHSVNVNGTLNVLESARINEINQIIFSSSAAVYGNPIRLPIDEDHVLNPVSIYGATKVIGETYLKVYSHVFGINCKILRFFNVYGPGQSGEYSGVISTFLRNIFEGKPLIVYGDGNQTRDFVFVEDICNIIERLIDLDIQGYSVFNVGTSKPTSINKLIEILQEIFGRRFKVVYTRERAGDLKHSYANNKRLLKALGSYSFIPLYEGLKKTIEWFENSV